MKTIGPFAPELPPQETLFDFIPIPDTEPVTADVTVAPLANVVTDIPEGQYYIKRHEVQDSYLAVKNQGVPDPDAPRPVIVLPDGTRAPTVRANFVAFGLR